MAFQSENPFADIRAYRKNEMIEMQGNKQNASETGNIF